MKLSIIIVSYNTADLTIACVKSILKNPPSVSYEIIVVDNNSTDNSVEQLKKISKCILIENRANLGFSKANNQGIKISKGEYILLLNSDTLVVDGSIDKLLSFAEKTDDAGVVGPKLLNKDRSLQYSCFRLPTIRRAVMQYWFGNKGILDKYSPTYRKPAVVESLVGAAFLITPKALKKVGKLDEKYFMFFEDLDYCKKIGEANLKVYYYPEAFIIHIHGASGAPGNKLLVESSKKYFGLLRYYVFTFILWSGQKMRKVI